MKKTQISQETIIIILIVVVILIVFAIVGTQVSTFKNLLQ